MYLQGEALKELNKYQPSDDSEVKAKAFITEFVEKNVEYWSRRTLAGHLTASAWITDAEKTKAVLLHHKKLDMWVQPGGHIDDEDTSLLSAALREASEETGISDLVPKTSSIFDLDVHVIPERKDEPTHWHLDIRFWFVAENTNLVLSDESNDLVWLSADSIREKTNEESVIRMVRKSIV